MTQRRRSRSSKNVGRMIAGYARIGIAPGGAYASMDLRSVVAAPRNGGEVAASRSGNRELHLYDKNRQNLQTCRYDVIHRDHREPRASSRRCSTKERAGSQRR
jgi:hypothetical protein